MYVKYFTFRRKKLFSKEFCKYQLIHVSEFLRLNTIYLDIFNVRMKRR